MKTIKLDLLVSVALLAIGLSSCQKDVNPTPAAGIQKESLSQKVLKHISTNPKKTLSDSLLAYYPFSGNATDESGHGYNAADSGATLTTGKPNHKNSAYSFNGTSNYMTLPVSYGNDTNQFSLYARVKRGANGVLLSSGDFYRQDATSLGISSDSTSIHIAFSWQRAFIYPLSHKVYLRFGGADGSLTLSSKDDWNDIVVTFDNSVLKIYVNGKLVSSGTYSLWPTVNHGFLIGVSTYILDPRGFLNGVVDELRFYARPLTPAEIDYLYKHN